MGQDELVQIAGKNIYFPKNIVVTERVCFPTIMTRERKMNFNENYEFPRTFLSLSISIPLRNLMRYFPNFFHIFWNFAIS